MVALGLLLGAPAATVRPASAAGAANPPSPPPASRATVHEFPLSSPASRPYEITRGPDGNLWFTEPGANQVGRITPSGVITEFSLPSPSANPGGITRGPMGNLWFTEAGGIARITTKGVITEYPIPGEGLGSITTGPDGNLWFTGSNRVGRMTPAGRVTEFPTTDPTPAHITTGPDGNLWYTDSAVTHDSTGVVARVTTTGVITPFTIPSPAPEIFPYPTGITAGPDGNLWFTEQFGGRIARITPSGRITYYPVPSPGSGPADITRGPDGDLWFTENFANRIGRITTAGVITEFHLPTPASGPWGIVTGPDAKLWFTEQDAGKIANLDPSTVKPPARPCLTITRSTVLTHDVGPCRGDGIVVAANDLTLNLNGHRVFAAAGPRTGDFAGVHLRNVRGVTVSTGTVSGFDAGVLVDHGAANTVTHLDLHDNIGAPDPGSYLGDGVVVIHSAGNALTANTVVHNGIFDGIGIIGLDSDRNRLEGNKVLASTDADVGDHAPGAGTGIIVNPFFEPENPRRGESLTANAVVGNTVRDSVTSGISNISNTGAAITGNVVEHNGFRPDGSLGGFPGNGLGVAALFRAVPTTHDRVEGNRSVGNAGNGIQVLSQANRLTANATEGNGVGGFAWDLRDENEDCDANVWRANLWGSGGFSPSCVTVGGNGPPAPAAPTAAPTTIAPTHAGLAGLEPYSRGKHLPPH